MECQALCEKDVRGAKLDDGKAGRPGALGKCYLSDPASRKARTPAVRRAWRRGRGPPQLNLEEVADRDPTSERASSNAKRRMVTTPRCNALRSPRAWPPVWRGVWANQGICLNEAARALAIAGGGVPQEWADTFVRSPMPSASSIAPPLTWSAGLAAKPRPGPTSAPATTGYGRREPCLLRPSASNGEAFQNSWYCEVAHYDFNAPQVVGGLRTAATRR